MGYCRAVNLNELQMYLRNVMLSEKSKLKNTCGILLLRSLQQSTLLREKNLSDKKTKSKEINKIKLAKVINHFSKLEKKGDGIRKVHIRDQKKCSLP